MKNEKIYAGMISIVFSVLANLASGQNKPVNKAVFIPFDESVFKSISEVYEIKSTGIGNISHNGNIVIGGMGLLHKKYKGQTHSEYPLTEGKTFKFNLKDKSFEFDWMPRGQGFPIGVTAISDNGEVAVGNMTPYRGFEVFRWTKQTGIVNLGHLPHDVNDTNARIGGPFGLTPDGNIVVGSSGYEAFRWTEKTDMVGLGFLPGATVPYSVASAISADGKTIVGSSKGALGDIEAFKWTKSEGMVSLEPETGKFWSTAHDVSADGSIIVGRSHLKSDGEAFYWTKATGMVSLHKDINEPELCSEAIAVSDDGKIIIGDIWRPAEKSKYGRIDETFIWTAEKGMRNLKTVLINDYNLPLENWQFKEVKAISGDGTVIVGNGRDPQDREIGWIVKFTKD